MSILISWDWQGKGHTWGNRADGGNNRPGRTRLLRVIGLCFPLRVAFCQTAFPALRECEVAKIPARQGRDRRLELLMENLVPSHRLAGILMGPPSCEHSRGDRNQT